MKKLFFMVLVAFAFTSCNSGSTESSETPQTDSTAVQVDSLPVVDTTVVDSI